MAFTQKTWKDRVTEHPNRRVLTPVDGATNTYDVARAEGTIMTEGDPLNAASLNDLEQRVADAILAQHPIGSIYLSTVNTAPGTLFGGTWVAWGAGRVPIGVDTSQTEFATVEKTGGEKTHTLTIAEMPKHYHLPAISYGTALASATSNFFKLLGANSTSGKVLPASNDNSENNITPAGGDGAHNNLQPYITCYMWKRTA